MVQLKRQCTWSSSVCLPVCLSLCLSLPACLSVRLSTYVDCVKISLSNRLACSIFFPFPKISLDSGSVERGYRPGSCLDVTVCS